MQSMDWVHFQGTEIAKDIRVDALDAMRPVRSSRGKRPTDH